ncbi:MAG: T9SS type A sorting domain-containing protein [Prevotella sp.]|nr:T9SS type A sorting domain-containing protein [Prevotella sp.]MBP5355910.1 T9SS type A sorting domain-containing protein [Prevotella sp.]MBR5391428.1 T9SS type A sorting domain-containing protein [Prevotella sp.]MBR6884426.1 T9SS type A sorting domain-containing protein [Prevotella sp.]
MNKRLLMITLAAALVFGVPVSIMANTSIEIIEQEIVQPTVVLQGNTLHVNNASGQMLYIYNVAGVRVMSVKVEGAEKSFELSLPKGCYIVKVGKVVRKISVK